jgi:hypothetical protein
MVFDNPALNNYTAARNDTSATTQANALPPGKKRLVLTSVNQVIMLVKNMPALAQQVPRLQGLVALPMSSAPKKSCNCGSKQNFTTPDAGKQQAESILTSLNDADYLQIKNILKFDELCYYRRENGELVLKCV